ncbi:MAG: hypothetical protein JWP26_2559 [Devosia sp.]|uniref:hypothetical protein n=1 Tax=Devosia sp. TaxID=1871048 RepID=UPI002620E71C|nr:hypothetical protein [Devosia sp.]MDB5587589.1 hypothetical protein [Devosia sp.]
MTSWARFSASFASRLRARLHLSLFRKTYLRALSDLPTITGPAVVVGSAPNPHPPKGLNDNWFVISVNASQVTAEQFGLPRPDLSILRDNIFFRGNVFVPTEIHDALWAALRGRQTAHAVAIMGSSEDKGATAQLAIHDYRADSVTELDRHVRGAVIMEMTGLSHVGLSAGISNGIFAALLAVKLGANPVVMSGFSFTPGWHFAKDVAVPRGHVQPDRAVLKAMVDRGYPVFASDPDFAKNSGLPLWTGPTA